MHGNPPARSPFAVLGEPEVCGQCQSVSRLTNGLCLNCLLRGALGGEDAPADKETFKEVLASVKPREGDWRIADHEILHEIARGGMGVVYQARAPHSDRIVALKCVLAYHDNDHLVARFRREAETAARLEHPNIVPIYQVGETAEGAAYYTMKYAAAGSLLQARRPLLDHPRQSAALMVKVARAVHYAHEKGVLHRDLKPGNILLDSHGEPLVSDFGLARCEAVSSYLTRSLASFGTPGYIAPEQADGPAANLTAAADVYSLGAILFELLTGRTPFVGDNAFAVMKQSALERAPKVRTFAPNVDRDLEIICDRCLERDPADRYQSAAELADDLQSWLDDRPIRARPLSGLLHARRWVRRNRPLAATLAVLALVAAGSFVWQIRVQKIQAAMAESVVAARSVVILPFVDLDTVAQDQAATQWAQNLLRAHFEKFGPGKVIASAAPAWSKPDEIRNAARQSRGRAVVTGTVRNVDGKRRISLRLLDPAQSNILYSIVLEQPEGTGNSAGVTTDWTREIYKLVSTDDWSPVLNARMDPGLRNPEANDDITAGQNSTESYTVSGLDNAIALFKRAIAKQPDSVIAHAWLAMAATGHTHYVADESFLDLGKKEAAEALRLDPNSIEAHRALSGIYFQEGKFPEALQKQLRTVELGGIANAGVCVGIGSSYDMLGRPDRALSWFGFAAKLVRQPGAVEPMIGDSWAKLGDDEAAFHIYDRAMELQAGSSRAAEGKAHLHLLRGEFDLGRDICAKHVRNLHELGEMAQIAAQIEFFDRKFSAAQELYEKLAKTDAHGGGSFYGAITYQSALGRIKQELNDNTGATALLRDSLDRETANLNRQPSNPEAAYRVAAVEASLNLSEAALRHLQQAIAMGWLDYRSLQRDPRFDRLRTNPELATLIDGLSAKVAELRSKAKGTNEKVRH